MVLEIVKKEKANHYASDWLYEGGFLGQTIWIN